MEQADLLGVVLIRGQPYAILDRALVARLRELLSQRVRGAVRAKDFVPIFNEVGIRNNRFQIACCNRDSYTWLEWVIGEIELTHTGAERVVRLCLVPPNAVPKPIRAAVYAPRVSSAPDFLELIQGQNPGLVTDRWVLRHCQAIGNGTLHRWDSARILADSNYSDLYKSGQNLLQHINKFRTTGQINIVTTKTDFIPVPLNKNVRDTITERINKTTRTQNAQILNELPSTTFWKMTLML